MQNFVPFVRRLHNKFLLLLLFSLKWILTHRHSLNSKFFFFWPFCVAKEKNIWKSIVITYHMELFIIYWMVGGWIYPTGKMEKEWNFLWHFSCRLNLNGPLSSCQKRHAIILTHIRFLCMLTESRWKIWNIY